MSYAGFLAVFLVVPIFLLWLVSRYDTRRGKTLPRAFQSWPAGFIILAHALIALLYTTPWDNYLVATRVWWYNPQLVTGIVIGYVPIEEYTFFVLQPILTGLWLLLLARHLPISSVTILDHQPLRLLSTLVAGGAWLASIIILVSGWQAGTYLGLLFVWALPPVMLQLAFGADILWKHRRIIFLTIIPMTLYLAAADKLAITSGTWTINPEQSLNIFLLGRLPLEEFIFFFMTNALIALGVTLVLSVESKRRAARYVQAARNWLRPAKSLGPSRDSVRENGRQ